jgi:hypothetical protein
MRTRGLRRCAPLATPLLLAAALAVAAPAAAPPAPAERTVANALEAIGPEAGDRLRRRFAAHGVDDPPERVELLAFKREARIEVRAWSGGRAERAAVYPLRAASGGYGPKLREGDEQIPEGIYRVTLLNPNSEYHLSMKLDYPNELDRARAAEDGRTRLGGEIFLHGDTVSIGCLAVGDPAVEELFVLAAAVGIENVRVLIAPWDFRHEPPPTPRAAARLDPDWLPRLYAELAKALAAG